MPQEREALLAELFPNPPVEKTTTGRILRAYWEEGDDLLLEADDVVDAGHEILDAFGASFQDNLEYLQEVGLKTTAMLPQDRLHKKKGERDEVVVIIGDDRLSVSSHADARHREVTYHWEGVDPRTNKNAFETLEIDVAWPGSEYMSRIHYEHGYEARGLGHIDSFNSSSAIDNAVRFYQRTRRILSRGTSVNALLQTQAPQTQGE
ncbi:MAG: hypothetical protein HYV40_03870 [Candidatus Levybacteria bacterium]|nr:hypothetical protein [Candidatus Levybacteria bacterium]